MLPSSAGCQCHVPPSDHSWLQGEQHAGPIRPSISLLYHWSPFYQQFGPHQHQQWYHHQCQYQVHQLYDSSAFNILELAQETMVTEAVSKHASLDFTEANETKHVDRSRRNSTSTIEEYKVRGRRKYDPKYSFKEIHGIKSCSKQSEEIAQEFKRLGIGFCFQGTVV